MKKGGGKRKGSAFERKVAGLLDKWWKVPKNTFWRTVNSGGWKQPGDITSKISEDGTLIKFPFIVECKHYNQIDIWKVLRSNNAKIIDWWKQVTNDQEKVQDKARLLIFRQNNSQILVAFNDLELNKLKNQYTTFPFVNTIRIDFYINKLPESIHILPWDVFIQYYLKEDFYE